MTTWKAVPDHPGYEVSSDGRIRSYRRSSEPRELKATPASHGYLTVRFSGTSSSTPIHHVVALAFLGPRPDGMDIRHLDGNKAHNAVSNLAYGTRSENQADKFRHGTHPAQAITHCPSGHPYGEAASPGHKRVCQPCRLEIKRRHYARVKDRRAECPDCGKDVQAWSLNKHRSACPGTHPPMESSTGSWVPDRHTFSEAVTA